MSIRRLGVDIRLCVEGNPGIVEEARPDAVFIATGSRPVIPPIPGIEKKIVVSAPDVLMGKHAVRDRVVVIGGGLVGCETAIWLAQQGKKVTVVEMLPALMMGRPAVIHMNRMMLLDMLRFQRVDVLTGTRASGIEDDGVILTDSSKEEEVMKTETVVLAAGMESDKTLFTALRGKRPNLYLIGDARETRNIMGAVWDAYEVARAI